MISQSMKISVFDPKQNYILVCIIQISRSKKNQYTLLKELINYCMYIVKRANICCSLENKDE